MVVHRTRRSPFTESDYEGYALALGAATWRAALFGPITWPEGFLIGVFDNQLVGISEIRRGDGAGALNIALTGVLREHRGKGIAKALKLRGLQVPWSGAEVLADTQEAQSEEALTWLVEQG